MKKINLVISILFLGLVTFFKPLTVTGNNFLLGAGEGPEATMDTTAGSLSFTVRTVSYGGNYAPKHVLAIWIKDNAGNFVKSLKVRAANRKQHLVKWNASSNGNVVDAITGATLSSHTTHTVTWDCKDVNGYTVNDDDYQIWMEYTSENSNYNGNPGPSASISFTKGSTAVNFNPSDESYFKDMIVEYMPTGVSISEVDKNISNLQIFPNPVNDIAIISFSLENDANISLKVIDMNGKVVSDIFEDDLMQAGNNEISWKIIDSNGNKLSPGIYNIMLSVGGSSSTIKVVVSK